MSEVKDEVVEEAVEESVEEPKGVEEVLAEELSNMRGESSDESSETPVAEEGEPEGDNAGGAEEGSGSVPEEDEEAWLAGQSERSQERYRQLAERARAAEEESAKVRAQGQELYKIMGDSGVTPNDMTAYFEYHKSLRNGGDPSQYWEQMEKAHSQYTGNKVGNADPLNNHPDLMAKVEEFEVTEEAARELASLRDYSERMKQVEEQNAQQQAQYGAETRQYQEAATYAQSASVELDRWSEDMKAKDPQFSQKEALLLERAQEQFPNIHPAYWPQFIANEYAYISKAFPTEASAPAPNAIRPGSTGGGNLQPEPKNISEALSNALREMRD
ncbi:MAG: hypothetical protein P8R36_04740 [Actinomycetota bacterium]|nr:hypothetical protein [Actinomycetota bacterium]